MSACDLVGGGPQAGFRPKPKNQMAIGERGGQESAPMNDPAATTNDFNRRDFLRGGSLATLMTLMGGVALEAEEKPKEAEASAAEKSARTPVNCAVIGCGVQGREILNTLARQPNASVVAVCDNYDAFLKRAKEAAPS